MSKLFRVFLPCIYILAHVASASAEPPEGKGKDKTTTKIVFVTSAKYNGALDPDPANCGDGIDGSDCICQYHADQAGITGTFFAWLSSPLSSPATDMNFVKHDGPYVRVDGVVVAANWDDLTDITLLSAIEVDENGNHPFPSDLDDKVWTATTWKGTFWQGAGRCSCGPTLAWCSSSAGLVGGYGAFTQTPGGTWTEFKTGISCDSQLRLYCFQQ